MIRQLKSQTYLIALDGSASVTPELVGMKATGLNQLLEAGFAVPKGFLINHKAYADFLQMHQFDVLIQRQLPAVDSTNHEQWAIFEHQIAHAFAQADLPSHLYIELEQAYHEMALTHPIVVVRSSALAEDLANASFAGIYTSVLDIRSFESFISAIISIVGPVYGRLAPVCIGLNIT